MNIENPDLDKYPKTKDLEGYEIIVKPGDVLYIPSYWFHYIEILDNDDDGDKSAINRDPIDRLNISVNFWYKISI